MVVKMFFCGKRWLMWRGGRFYWGMVRKKNMMWWLTLAMNCGIIHRRKGKVSLRKVNFKQGERHGWT